MCYVVYDVVIFSGWEFRQLRPPRPVAAARAKSTRLYAWFRKGLLLHPL